MEPHKEKKTLHQIVSIVSFLPENKGDGIGAILEEDTENQIRSHP